MFFVQSKVHAGSFGAKMWRQRFNFGGTPFTSLLSAFSLVACQSLENNYAPPSLELAAKFVHGRDGHLNDAATREWWLELQDRRLNELIELGVRENFDIKLALERIHATELQAGILATRRQVSGGITGEFERESRNGIRATGETLSLGGSYIIDLFGMSDLRESIGSSELDASEFDAAALRLSVLRELTAAYQQATYAQSVTTILRRNINSVDRTLSSVEELRLVGKATELDIQRARAELAIARAELPVMEALIESSAARIATLTARPTQQVLIMLRAESSQRLVGFPNTVGLPSDLVRNRPDVRATERRLAAATAAIGMSEAQLYPSLRLSGAIGPNPAENWIFGTVFSVPIFNRDELKANIRLTEIEARSAEIEWRKGVFVALEQVQSALSRLVGSERRLNALMEAGSATATALTLSQENLRLGTGTLVDVLDAEKMHTANELTIAEAKLQYLLNWVDVHVLTGQGWVALEAELSVSPELQ